MYSSYIFRKGDLVSIKQDVMMLTWHENGILHSESYVENNKREGLYLSWNEDGSKLTESHWKNGKQNDQSLEKI